MRYKSLILKCILMPIAAMQADVTDIKFTTGYRKDKGTGTLNLTSGDGAYANEKSIVRETFAFDGISIYQLGGKAIATVAGCATRASINYGWVHTGKSTENFILNDATVYDYRGSIRKGSTRDINIGAVWFWMNNSFCQFGPSGGYAKSQQTIGLRRNNTNKNKAGDDKTSVASEQQMQNYKNKWQGPYVGGDAFVTIGDFTLKGGYEYHWAHWKATSTYFGALGDSGVQGKGESKHARGRVYFLDVGWNLWQCYTLGGGVKWQQWSAPVGKISKLQKLASILKPAKKNAKAIKWNSLVVSVDIGYVF